MKKFLRVLLLSMVVVAAMSLTAMAVTPKVVDSGYLNDTIKWKLYDSGLLKITGKGAIEGYMTIVEMGITGEISIAGDEDIYYRSPFYGNEDIKTVEIGQGITSIGRNTFAYCESLKSVSIPSSVKMIRENAFEGCKILTDVKVPKGTKVDKGVFTVPYKKNCKGGSIYFDYINGYIADADETVTSVKIPSKINGVKVKGILGELEYLGFHSEDDYICDWEGAFYGCDNLKSITIPKGIEHIGACAFLGSGITSIKVDKNNQKYTSVDGVLFTKNKSVLVSYPAGRMDKEYSVPKGTEKVKLSGFCWVKLEHLNVPKGVKLDSSCNTWFDRVRWEKVYEKYDKKVDTYWSPDIRSAKDGEHVSRVVKGIIYPSDINLSYESCSYTGEEKEPEVTVKIGGKKLTEDISYTVAYKNNVETGKATVIVTGMGKYAGFAKKTFIIHPAKVKNVKAAAKGKTYIKFKWSKATGATGYKVMYRKAGTKKWKSATTKSTTYKVSKLKKRTKYECKVKAYKKVDGKKEYGSPSKVIKVKTK